MPGCFLINLDHEYPDEILRACAGQVTQEFRFPLTRTERVADDVPIVIRLSNLPGGHSGLEIHKEHGNAIQMLARVCAPLLADSESRGAKIASIQGGAARNAIPEAASILVWAPRSEAEALAARINSPEVRKRIVSALDPEATNGDKRPRLRASIINNPLRARDLHGPLDPQVGRKLLTLACNLFHGVVEWDGDPAHRTPALSNNFAVLSTGSATATFTCMARHADYREADRLLGATVHKVIQLNGFPVELVSSGHSPGWLGNENSPLIKKAQAAYEAVHGRPARRTSVHAGIECGAFEQKAGPGVLDQVSLPIVVYGAHKVGECMPVGAIGEGYAVLKRVVEGLC